MADEFDATAVAGDLAAAQQAAGAGIKGVLPPAVLPPLFRKDHLGNTVDRQGKILAPARPAEKASK